MTLTPLKTFKTLPTLSKLYTNYANYKLNSLKLNIYEVFIQI